MASRRSQSRNPFAGRASIRIVDWTSIGIAGISYLSGALFVYAVGSGSLGAVAFGIAILAIGLRVVMLRLKGVVFYQDGKLSYPRFLYTQIIDLQEVSDANSEFGLRLSGFAFSRKTSKETVRAYSANLSGAFGSKQITFYQKRYRDLFFSILADAAPHVRITRYR